MGPFQCIRVLTLPSSEVFWGCIALSCCPPPSVHGSGASSRSGVRWALLLLLSVLALPLVPLYHKAALLFYVEQAKMC